MNCNGCGNSLQPGVVFCSFCGKFNPQNRGGRKSSPPPAPPVAPMAPPAAPVAPPPAATPVAPAPPVAPPAPTAAPVPPPPRTTMSQAIQPPSDFQIPTPAPPAAPMAPPPAAAPMAPPPSVVMPSMPPAGGQSSTQLYNVLEPWGEINVFPQGPTKRIAATLLTYEVEEGTKTGLALDGSLSMKKLYGRGAAAKGFFAAAAPQKNEVQDVARQMSEFLAEEVDYTGKTTVMYWACGNMGAEIEVLGEMDAATAMNEGFGGPAKFGKGTRLMPPLTHFESQSRDAAFAMLVCVTDGALDDLEEVKAFTVQLCQEIEAGRRAPFKGVLIGLGAEVDEEQLISLDDLETGTEVDVWDHKLATNLRQMWDIFAEVVSMNQIVAPSGRILDQHGHLLRDYPQGLPAVLEFEVPSTTTHLILEAGGRRTEPQPLF